MNDDATLLREFAANRSEAAFRELVRRHIDLVYSTALRRTDGNVHLAADVAQEVFTKLSLRAAELSRYAVLGAWLHTATRNAAVNLMISEKRRRIRETNAMAESMDVGQPGAAPDWECVRPVLDAAIDELSEYDRTAIVLRFLERKSFAAIGAVLQVSEDAARMRTDRALEKLRTRLARRGFTSSATALAALVAGQPLVSAPVGLAAALVPQALAPITAGVALPTLFTLMNAKLAITAVVAASALAGWMAFHFSQKEGRVALAARQATLVANRDKLAELELQNHQLADANAELQARLKARATETQASVRAPADRVEQVPWQTIAAFKRDGWATVTLKVFDEKTGRLGAGIADIFSLTDDERNAVNQALDRAHRELSELMVQNGASRIVDGKVELSVQPFAAGADIRERLLSDLATTFGPDRFEILNANIRNASGFDQTMGGFGLGTVTGTIIHVPTEDGKSTRFRIGLRVANALGSSSATNVDIPNATAWPDSMRWLGSLLPDLGDLPISAPDNRTNIAPDPLGLIRPATAGP